MLSIPGEGVFEGFPLLFHPSFVAALRAKGQK
jgi:hypothetical protein